MSEAQSTLDLMAKGNAIYVSEGGKPYRSSLKRGAARAKPPLATLLTCSDVRVFPEQVFGLETGELNVLQSAACACSDAEAAFSGTSLTSGLIIVMGHSPCGVIENSLRDLDPDHNSISASILRTHKSLVNAKLLPTPLLVARTHAIRVADEIRVALRSTKARVEAAHLNENDGRVTFLSLRN